MYRFPVITHIDDVREVIKDRDEFIIAERDFGYVVNYLVNLEDTFPEVRFNDDSFADDESYAAAIRRECRGLVFNKGGLVIARRLHKFFNINEKSETQENRISLDHPHIILEKLDGSMVTPIPMPNGTIRWGTKMGITGVSMEAESYIASHMHYEDLAKDCIHNRQTPIFEWCSRKNRIVIDYPDDQLVLLAIRDNTTGEYLSYDELKQLGHDYMVAVVDDYSLKGDLQDIIRKTRALEEQEGFVIRFDNGHMLKIKGDWYCQIHKCKESLAHEKNLIDLIINEKLDDLKPHLLPSDLQRVNEFEKGFWIELNDTVHFLRMERKLWKAQGDRKHFALFGADNFSPIERSVIFACWEDNKDERNVVLDLIKKSCGSSTNVDKVRSLWGGVKWEY